MCQCIRLFICLVLRLEAFMIGICAGEWILGPAATPRRRLRRHLFLDYNLDTAILAVIGFIRVTTLALASNNRIRAVIQMTVDGFGPL